MSKQRAFLKWAGGKYELVEKIKQCLPDGNQLVEPFVGAGSVFLNTNYDSYLLSDINYDLITLYNFLKTRPDSLINDLKLLFTHQNNQADAFYELRKKFNRSKDDYQRSLLFVYLNRHCYNGLCRYNSSGEFNVPFGRYTKIYFPEKEMYFFAEKAQKAKFICKPYQESMLRAKQDSVIYCDPPYLSSNDMLSFTAYYSNCFGFAEHQHLADLAEKIAERKKVSVLISNHDTHLTRKLYQNASHLYYAQMRRSISRNSDGRKKTEEVLALYQKT